MRAARTLALATVGLALLVAAAAAGFAVAARYGPERLTAWAESLLAEQIGPVEIGSLHLGFHWGPALEAREVRAAVDPAAAEARLEAASWRLSFDLTRLLRGELRVGRMKVAGLRATLVRDTDGTLHPEAARRLHDTWKASRAEHPGDAPPRGLRDALEELRAASAVLPALAIEDAEIRWQAAGEAATDAGLRGLDASFGPSGFGAGLSLAASGRLLVDGAEAGGFELRGELPAIGEPHAELALSDFDLAAASPWLVRWEPAREARLALTGRTAGHLAWRAEGERERIEVELVALGVEAGGRFGADGAAHTTHLASARAAAAITLAPDAFTAEGISLHLGPLELEGRVRVARPFTERTRIEWEAQGERLDVDALRTGLRASGVPALLRTADALASGRLAPWSLRCTGVRRSEWAPFAASPVDAWPEGCSVELGLEEIEVSLGDADPIRHLRGQLLLERDRLELRGVRARIGDRPLPALDLSVTGLRAVAAAIADGDTPPAFPPLPGWFTLDAWTKGDRKPGAPPRWQRAEIHASRLDHPALFRPVSELRAVLRPVPFGFDAEIEEAYWGSARVSGRARKSGDPPGRIEIHATARPGAGAPPRDAEDPAAWARAGFRVELTQLGVFRARAASGRIRMEGDRGEIYEGDVQLVPRGRLVGEVDLRLDRSDFVQAEGRLRIEGGSVPDLLEDLKLDREAMTGTAHLSGDLSAKLIPRENVLREMTGPLTLKLREGEIRQRMHLLVAIAAASDTFNPFRSREVLPFEEIEGELALDRGTLRAESLSLVGPAARLVATGDVDIVDAPHQVEAVVGLYFFKTLDTVISKVPLVNRLLLGDDDNLVAAYFALSGPWKGPEARVLPATLFSSGPFGIVTEGVPGFVRSGIETLQRLFGGDASDEADDPPRASPGSRLPQVRP